MKNFLGDGRTEEGRTTEASQRILGGGGVYQGEDVKRVLERRRKAEGMCLVCRTAGIVVACSWNGEWLWGVMFWSWRSRRDEVIKDLIQRQRLYRLAWLQHLDQLQWLRKLVLTAWRSPHVKTVGTVLDSQRGLGRSDGPEV